MLATLQRLGVMPSFSRPSVSNDNPYSEALFKTLKYHPGFPDKPFQTLEEAREWVAEFQHWDNEVHRHSALKFVTPGQRHRGEDIAILEQRNALYEATREQCLERWSGSSRNWEHNGVVFLNPNKSTEKEDKLKGLIKVHDYLSEVYAMERSTGHLSAMRGMCRDGQGKRRRSAEFADEFHPPWTNDTQAPVSLARAG